MKHTHISLILSILLILSIIFNLGGCTAKVEATNLMKDVTPRDVIIPTYSYSPDGAITDFALRLFKESNQENQNTLISPLSVLYALAMTSNGAEGETLKQIEDVIGINSDLLNPHLYNFSKNLPQNEKYKLNLANSIWFNEAEHFTANQDFLQTNADYYGADIFKAPFNDRTTKDINNWVSQKTDEMIPEILDNIPPDAVMYLVNALAFEAEWETVYKKEDVKNGKFFKADGTAQTAEFMYSSEYNYLEDKNAKGFIKYYKDGKYAFVALLPNENITLSDYVASLDGASLYSMLKNPQNDFVKAAIPKFETEYSVNMAETLSNMGITDAFDMNKADFKGLGSSTVGNIYINRVLHKTYISVAEKGTKAGAATTVEMFAKMSLEHSGKEIYLNRPFLYMIIDTTTATPFFIGTMTDVE
jgi:serpin B